MRSDLGRISEALIASGYTSLDEQAEALGLRRSTTWTITKNKHKLVGSRQNGQSHFDQPANASSCSHRRSSVCRPQI